MRKSGLTAFIFWALGLVGLCGLHRFYVGRPFTGILWLLTFGLLGFGQLFDLFFLGSMVRQANILNGLGNMNHNSNMNTVAPVFNVSVNVPIPTAPATADIPPISH
jgi:TM2 domain-containing membrane protein YozV